jgi:hypothetical protein
LHEETIMKFIRVVCASALLSAAAAVPADGQLIHCIDPPSTAPSEAACRIEVDPATRELRLQLQLRAPDDTPIVGQVVNFTASHGVLRDRETTRARGYVDVLWQGSIQAEPVVITARASLNGVTTTRQIRVSRRTPAPPAFIKRMSPSGDHSAFAGRFLSDDIEAELEATPVTCNRTVVVFEYLSVGAGGTPEPKKYESPALWSELDRNRFGCAARLRWALSGSAGKQTLRAWVRRDSTFAAVNDSADAQRYLRPFDVRAIAHALPSFLAGAAVIEAGATGDSTKSVAPLIGFNFSLPSLADALKHNGLQGPGELVDRTRLFIGTDFGTNPGRNVYLGVEPLVLLLGPRAADIPVGFAAGRRVGEGRDRWFGAGFVNASTLATTVLKGLGIS